MKELKSKDGTVIAYETAGEGPALVIVDGALTTRSSGSKAQLVRLLAPHATVYTYDRRGRGDSSDTFPYAVEREIEDIAALIDEAGGTAVRVRSLRLARALPWRRPSNWGTGSTNWRCTKLLTTTTRPPVKLLPGTWDNCQKRYRKGAGATLWPCL